ncbi:hypothetical protein [Phytobacter ursingii]|uniref:hypothetical protein n=1 Tax=Phytobacter ursingii TaxID=1972431 RepID=UPI003CCCDFBC
MLRRYEINAAFRAAVQRNPKGYMCLRHGFIRELRHYNHHFSKRDANRWIELNQPEFVDKHQTTAKTGYGCYAAWGVFANADA